MIAERDSGEAPGWIQVAEPLAASHAGGTASGAVETSGPYSRKSAPGRRSA